MKRVEYEPIGVIHSPFTEPAGTPIQPVAAGAGAGTVEVLPEFAGGLKDLDGFSHIFLLFHCHRAGPPRLEVTPFMDTERRGLFATRAPSRPNPIGLSVVRLDRVDGNTLHVRDLDILDGTPLLDIKPYVPAVDVREGTRTGWLEEKGDRLSSTTDDGRFTG